MRHDKAMGRQASKRTDRWSTVRRVLGERSSTFLSYIDICKQTLYCTCLGRQVEVFLWLILLNLGLGFFVMDVMGRCTHQKRFRGPQHLCGREISQFMSIQDLWVMLERNAIKKYNCCLHICMYFLHVDTYLNWLDPLSGRSCLLFCSRSWITSRGFFHDVNTTAACQCSERVSG